MNSQDSGHSEGAQEVRVAEILRRIRAGVRQRQAEVATLGGQGEGALQPLLEIKAAEHVAEPHCVSHRPFLGRFIVLARKGFFHLFMKWYLRPILEQQNRFNRAASRLLQGLLESHSRLAQRVEALSRRLDALEERLEPEAPETESLRE